MTSKNRKRRLRKSNERMRKNRCLAEGRAAHYAPRQRAKTNRRARKMRDKKIKERAAEK